MTLYEQDTGQVPRCWTAFPTAHGNKLWYYMIQPYLGKSVKDFGTASSNYFDGHSEPLKQRAPEELFRIKKKLQ